MKRLLLVAAYQRVWRSIKATLPCSMPAKAGDSTLGWLIARPLVRPCGRVLKPSATPPGAWPARVSRG
jgi:hypothetical protein